MNENIVGKIYILTNPSFPDYVKIGYSKNVEERLNRLNNSEAVPFGFRLYATYDVETQSADKVLHKIIDKFYETIDKFIHWICVKFDIAEEDNLIRDFQRETNTFIDPEKQIKRENKEKDFELEL